MRALGTRLAVGLGASLLLLFLFQAVLAGAGLRELSQEIIVSHLRHDSESLLAALSVDAKGRLFLDENRVPAAYRRPFSGFYFVVRGENQTFRSRSLWDETLPDLAPGLHPDVSGPRDQRLLALSRRFDLSGAPLRVVLAEDRTPLLAQTAAFQRQLLQISLPITLLLLALQMLIVRLSLRPLQRTRLELAQLERGEIRQLSPRGPAEIRPLVTEINHLIEVLHKRLQRSRNALGNLAHALKTPLTVAGQLLDRPGERIERERVAEQVELIRERIERELAQARLAGGGVGGGWKEPRRDLDDLAGSLRTIHRDKPLDIELDVPAGLRLRADREDMLELFGNLLDNACKWATHRIRCRLRAEADGAIVIGVEDDGPGIDTATAGELVKRGARADENTPGHGLGLAIVQEIVHAYDGTLSLDRAPGLGGLRVQIRLPGFSAEA